LDGTFLSVWAWVNEPSLILSNKFHGCLKCLYRFEYWHTFSCQKSAKTLQNAWQIIRNNTWRILIASVSKQYIYAAPAVRIRKRNIDADVQPLQYLLYTYHCILFQKICGHIKLFIEHWIKFKVNGVFDMKEIFEYTMYRKYCTVCVFLTKAIQAKIFQG
jgi:hypothetical protein